MNNYRKLNLPSNPVKDVPGVVNTIIRGGYNIVRPEEVLTNELLSTFKTIGLKPVMVCLFGRGDQDGKLETRMIHADVQLAGKDKFQKSSWKKLIFGINWELMGSENLFSWWDMSALKECWPAEELGQKYNILNGIHYVKRGNLGVPSGAIKLEETPIVGPTLVRTEIPHMTVYKNKSHTRVGVSVRFDESSFSDWQSVTEFLKPITL
jgi:hypothetical protein